MPWLQQFNTSLLGRCRRLLDRFLVSACYMGGVAVYFTLQVSPGILFSIPAACWSVRLRYGRHYRRFHLGWRGQCGQRCACSMFRPYLPSGGSEPSSARGSSASSMEGRSDLLERIKALQDDLKALRARKRKCALEIKKRHEAEAKAAEQGEPAQRL